MREGVRVRVAHEDRETLELLGARRQRMGLAVGHHLQPVLDAAEEADTRSTSSPAARSRQMAGAGQAAERGQRCAARAGRGRARPRPARSVCATNSISRMPPRPSLTLCPAIRATASAGAGAALFCCASMRRFMAWISAMAAKSRWRRQTKGRIAARNCVPERDVARDRARLDHRRALPVLPHALVIGERRGQRDRGRRRGRVGAQAQIGAEDVAIRVARFHDRNQVARQA